MATPPPFVSPECAPPLCGGYPGPLPQPVGQQVVRLGLVAIPDKPARADLPGNRLIFSKPTYALDRFPGNRFDHRKKRLSGIFTSDVLAPTCQDATVKDPGYLALMCAPNFGEAGSRIESPCPTKRDEGVGSRKDGLDPTYAPVAP